MGDFEAIGLFAPEPLTESHNFSDFRCGRPSLDAWLSDRALTNQSANYTRTFVVRDAGMRVWAYYALCAGIILRKDMPRSQRPHGSPSEIPIALLARLAVHEDLHGKGIGKALLTNALRNAASASQAVAFRAVVVDALDAEAAGFYQKLGFQPTPISPLKLILPTQDILASMGA
ncbi:GNAT family N-acetyltransferase [Aurantimonas aggregata]|uniref:GNAT family N-acetyltransferase n=1 Tax=Aurantimonas aggregata TaxID=2047720 RepID=A0A6L9MJD9_9HYPH|nr:GNAT family N-acetyltransferase [Aurantimonas aggregata]